MEPARIKTLAVTNHNEAQMPVQHIGAVLNVSERVHCFQENTCTISHRKILDEITWLIRLLLSSHFFSNPFPLIQRVIGGRYYWFYWFNSMGLRWIGTRVRQLGHSL